MTHQYDSSNNLVGLQYCMVGYSPTWDAFWSVYLTCILIALSATGYGYMISALAPTVEAANALAPPLMVPLLLFGGFFLQSDSVPDYFIWLKYLSWFYYGAENLYVTQWKDSGACMSQVAARPDINPDNIFRQIQVKNIIYFIIIYNKFPHLIKGESSMVEIRVQIFYQVMNLNF